MAQDDIDLKKLQEFLAENAKEVYEALVAAEFTMGCENLYEQEGYEKTYDLLRQINPAKYEF